MKKTLLIILLLIPFFGFSQTTTKPIDGFLGIKFGSTKIAVMAAMKARGAKLDPNSDATNLAFTNISMAHRSTEVVIIRFVNGKAYEGDIFFTPADNDHAIAYYNDLVSDLNDSYGKGQDSKKFTSPYADGDGHEVTALLIGAADYNTYWQAANSNTINASINKESDTSLSVELTYQDDVLTQQAIDKQKAKDKGDL
jgi:hypothetical protein